MGQEFDIDKRHAQIICQVFIVLTFSSGMPLLYPVGLLCAFSSYWIDKYLFLRLYRKPPLYDGSMAARARNLVKVALLIHCIMSIYIYSNDQIFTYKDSNSAIQPVREDVNQLLVGIFGRDISYLETKLQLEAGVLKRYLNLFKGHSIMYMVGVIFFFAFVIIQEMFGLFTWLFRFLGLAFMFL